jgi:hypothetical protein
MEVLKYSKENIKDDFFNCESLKEIIENIDQMMRQQGRVVTKISINGLLMNEQDEARLSETKISEIHDIEVETEKESQIFNTSMQTTKQFLAQLKAEIIDLAERFRKIPDVDERQRFVQAMGDCQLLTEALVALRPYLNNSKDAQIRQTWDKSEAHFLTTLRELVAAYEAGDRMLVSDVLEYELSNTLDQWLDFLSKSD